jgi:hypothetical protein
MPDVSLSVETLAIWGALFGTIGSLSGAIALVNFLRDRPHLRLLTMVQMLGHDREFVMTVVNEGRRPAVLLEAGLAIQVDRVSAGTFRRKRSSVGAELGQPEPGVLPVTLGPFAALQWSFKYDARRPPHGDSIAFVRDSDGRYTWASQHRAKPDRRRLRP